MRIWGRTTSGQWVAVTTDANGFNDYVYIVDLIQNLRLTLGESPMYANNGIPAQQSVLTQVFPDYNTYATQRYFSQFFPSVSIQKVNSPTPTYDINVVRNNGSVFTASIPF